MRNGLMIDSNGDHHWFLNDKRHRADGPAIECVNGDKLWCQNDKLHRVDGPAIEHHNGDTEWYIDNKSHRRDGPALDRFGTRIWCINNKFHRRYGAAVERNDGTREWWYEGIKETHEANHTREQNRLVDILNFNIPTQLPIESSSSSKFPLMNLIVNYL
jgi:hypothetical protein